MIEIDVLDGPTREDLEAIEADWPLIAAEMDLVTAECRLALDPTSAVATTAWRDAARAVEAAKAAQRNAHEVAAVTPIALAHRPAAPLRTAGALPVAA